jgi:hypothetical protein
MLFPDEPDGAAESGRGTIVGWRTPARTCQIRRGLLPGRICGSMRIESVHCQADQSRRFYDKLLARKVFTHDLKELLNHARLSDVFAAAGQRDPIFAVNWQQVSSWTEESRYGPRTQQEAEELITALRDPRHGVMPRIRQYW